MDAEVKAAMGIIEPQKYYVTNDGCSVTICLQLPTLAQAMSHTPRDNVELAIIELVKLKSEVEALAVALRECRAALGIPLAGERGRE